MRLVDIDNLQIIRPRRSVETPLADAFEKFLKELPTVEAEPVRHGRWIVRRYGCSEELVIDCSACNDSAFSLMPFEMLVRGFKYCPNCGAKMDEVEKEE